MDSNNTNSVSLHPDGYIEVIIRGDQNYMTYDQLRGQIEKFINKLQFEKKAILGLVDLTNIKSINPSSNKGAFELLEAFPYQKVALFGCNTAVAKVTNLIIQAIGKADKTKIFSDEELALKWLLNK
jgi:hypothetical protein